MQISPPSNPPLVHVCGAVLYCTITLTVLFGFDSNGSRSGEILELSAKGNANRQQNEANDDEPRDLPGMSTKEEMHFLPQGDYVQCTPMVVQIDNCGQDCLGVTERNRRNTNPRLKPHDSTILRSG